MRGRNFRNRVNFLQQVVVPTPAVLAQYQRLDDALDDATARIMGLDLLRLPGTPAARGLADPVVVAQRARLPARLRGTGHRRMVDVALAAFIGSMAMVIPRMPDRTDDNRDTIVGLFSHLVAVTGTGEDFQRKYEGSRRFSTFFRQADAIGIEMGTGLREAWETVRREVGDPAIGIFSVGAADLPQRDWVATHNSAWRHCPEDSGHHGLRGFTGGRSGRRQRLQMLH